MTPRTATLAVALGLSAAFAGAAAAVALAQPAAMDAVALYAGARLVATGHGAALLDPDVVLAAEREAAPERTALLPFVQPPAVALLLAPFGLLPYPVAFPLMVAFEALVLLAAVSLFWAAAPRLPFAAGALLVPRARSAPVLLALLVLAPPAAVALAQAQTSPLALLLVALGARAGPRVGGIALGATLLRPQVAPLLVLVGLLDPARRAATVGGALVVATVSVAVVGVDGIARYAATLVGAGAWSTSGDHGMRASIGWAGPAIALGAGELGLIASVLSLAIGAVAVARAAPEARVQVASTWSLVASPHVLLHDALLAYPALVALAARSPAWALLCVAIWIAHVAIAPIGVVASVVLTLGLARAGIPDGTLRRPDHR